MKAFRLIVITPADPLEGEQAIVRSLFRAGLLRLHLRKPGASTAALKAYLAFFSPAERAKIRVHSSDVSLLETGVAGLHLPFQRLDRRSLPGRNISTSIHSWQEYAKLSTGTDAPEYVFMGPVYDSISKPGYSENVQARKLPATRRIPVIALGGIRARDIPEIFRTGFAGAALLGAVWEQPEKATEIFSTSLQLLHQTESVHEQ